MKILFMGTPESAAEVLQALFDANKNIIGVVTQPDRPKGRHLKLVPPHVKIVALKFDIPILQPENIKDISFISILRNLNPDLIIVVAYGQILPKEILNIPKYGCINVHASLLPKYRGAAPIQWAIINGEKETGVTVFRLKETVDTGDIILQERIKIEENDSAKTLEEKIFKIGSQLVLRTIDQIEGGTANYIPQNETEATYADRLKKESGLLDFKKEAREIYNRIRAMDPWPGAYTFYNGGMLKIWSSDIKIVNLTKKEASPGTVVEIVKNIGFIIATGKGHLLVKEVQLASGKRMNAYEFAIGHKLRIGVVLPS